MISNAAPFIKNEALVKELYEYGQLVSPVRMVPLGCKSAKLKHIVCHRRQVIMILKDKETHLNLFLSINLDEYNYMVFVFYENMRFFGCGAEGYQVRSCTEKCGTQLAQPVAAGAASEAPWSFAAAVAGTAFTPAAVLVNAVVATNGGPRRGDFPLRRAILSCRSSSC